jgi:2-polyprenyl-3-methyl-5-hydroxy-6-metoxy-1,4-benzoquinol methylase
MTSSGNSIERIVPDELTSGFELISLQLHYERYRFAGQHIIPGRVLDIACGTGYGSHLLAAEFGESISEIVAVDISEESISYARTRYSDSKIIFVRQNAFSFTDERKFHSIVSLETIEHLNDPAAFVKKLYDLLHPGGIMIVSAPVTLSTDVNPYHVNDFSDKTFRALFTPYPLTVKDSLRQTQQISLGNIFGKHKNLRTEGMRKNLGSYYISHPKLLFARVWSVLTNGFTNKYRILVLQKGD